MEKSDILALAQRMLDDPKQTFILGTLTEDGYPDARLMGNICGKTLSEVYFTCPTGTRKIDELSGNPKSCLYFTSGEGTVWLYGEATATRDPAVRERVWDERMRGIYPEGPESPRLVIIRFVPERLRYRDRTSGYAEFDLPAGNV